MAKITGTRGVVNVEFLGIGEIIRKLQAKGKAIESKSDLEIARLANFMREEVQQSITGNRAETRSLDTGTLANAIDVRKEKKNVYDVFVQRRRYPTGRSTTDQVSKILEFVSHLLH